MLRKKQMKMSQTTCGHSVPATGWRLHCTNVNGVLQNFNLLWIQVVPAVIVHPLSQKFNWRLRPEFVLLRHIQVVNKDQTFFFSIFRPKVSFPSPTWNFSFNYFLKLLSWSLPTETNQKVSGISVLVIRFKLLYDCRSLAGARLTNNKKVLLLVAQFVK